LQSQLIKKNQAVVYRITIAQTALTAVITLSLYLVVGSRAAYSALIAGGISTFTTLYVGARIFFGAERSVRDRLASIYLAELVKLVFVAIAFIAAIKWMDVHFVPFVGTYLATVAVYWLALIWPVFGVQVKTIKFKN
jgi:F0F1-type ATP synthase assembly protein I